MKDDPQLRELLRTSLPDASVPRRFGAEVWERIQARREASANRGWTRFFEPLFALLTRPAFAAVALLLAAGGAAGKRKVGFRMKTEGVSAGGMLVPASFHLHRAARRSSSAPA